MSELTQFVLARIAEDEAGHRRDMAGSGSQLTWAYARRGLAQCAAMRKIVEEIEGTRQNATYTTRLLTILLYLASIWSDHPDFREEWR